MDGATPERHLLDVNGSLFGMAAYGGETKCHRSSCGALFSITTAGEERAFYFFKGSPDGSHPDGGLTYLNGEFYGTTRSGGAYNYGTVFKVDAFGTEHTLYSFYEHGHGGAYPEAGLTNVNGTFYGTTHGGGAHDRGTIFKITPSGKESVVYVFGGTHSDGAWPAAGLVLLHGVLYGTTTGGGGYCTRGCGTVFSVTPSGKERVIYTFGRTVADGGQPEAGLTILNGDLYGTTYSGGSRSCACGVVFRVTTSGVETILHRFRGYNKDGAFPVAGVTPANGALYGTTTEGGCFNGCGGTVYKIDAAGYETVLHFFGGTPDGDSPLGGLTYVSGFLYGTTAYGGTYCGSSGCGTVYKILP
jgi:uncharacterized repeat protein (TIGR03803 family)